MTLNPALAREHFKNNEVTLDFSSAFSLLSGNYGLPAEEAVEVHPKNGGEGLENFGLFGGEAQYTSFSPGIGPDDWQPKEEDFIYPIFRILSDTTVVKFGVPIVFGKEVLMDTVKKIENQTVYPDHKNDEVGNSLGVVTKAFWENSYKVDGVTVPAGVNAVLKIDAKSNPRIARALLMDPPAIHSGSVKVSFDWEKSHNLSDDEFWGKVGSYDKEGKLIALNVTKIKAYHEYSLVTHGADSFAQKVGEKGIANPQYTQWAKTLTSSNSSKADIDYSSLSFSKDNPNDNPLKPDPMNLIELLNPVLPTELQFTAESGEQDVLNLVSTLLKDKESLAAQVLELKNKPELTEEMASSLEFITNNGGMEAITEKVKNGEVFLNQVRTNAISNYKLLNADSIQEPIVRTIENADLEAARAFEQTYSTQVEKALPLVCENCKSTHITRASSFIEDGKPPTPDVKDADFEKDLEAENKKRRRKMSDIHTK